MLPSTLNDHFNFLPEYIPLFHKDASHGALLDLVQVPDVLADLPQTLLHLRVSLIPEQQWS